MPSLIQLRNVSLSVGSTLLLESANAQLVSGQRVALTGPNGCGKTTLLRALASDAGSYFVVSAGSVTLSPLLDISNGVLLVEQDNLKWSYLFGKHSDDEGSLRSLTLPEALDAAVAEGREGAIEDAEAWRRLYLAAKTALEWHTAEYDSKPLGLLSPGSAVRAYLAVALRRDFIHLLLLDEPTNHLDLPSILWLQKSLRESAKSIVVVSHDSAFLDAVCDHVWLVDQPKKSLEVSGVNYTDFQRARQLARQQQMVAYEAQQKRYEKLTAVAEKLRVASASGARSVAKDRDKLQRDFRRDRAGRSGRKASATETLRDSQPQVERVVERAPLQINIQALSATSNSSILFDDVVLGYNKQPLGLPLISLRIEFGEHVAIVGYNSIGKSTLLQTITGTLEPVSGTVTVGKQLVIGSLMQEHENLPRDRTPRDHFASLVELPPRKVDSVLIRYGLNRQQIDSSFGCLNPGARARALLAGFAMRSVNVLVLDEPTNHLDEEAMDEVLASLNVFKGTALIVSHSYAFLESLKLNRLLRLDSRGLIEIAGLDEFVGEIEDIVDHVIAASRV
ncbi:putative ABC transporter ATP-binding protein YbiT [Porphyridium purpureum]|uniref:Probable ATP-dependent transporter ycf16 n=1 Tax=Porphyridium purpureum TaxID=35688 RepID=A0A5J4YQS0_PORPP|nr:putative ABC transporter ATP-binding protein YbiT [Porphyridium purpureum]|eukprot:POR7380..scf236_6